MTDTFTSQRQPLMSGQADAEDRTYKMYEGREGRIWFVADQDNKADNIYLYNPSDAGKRERGFSGASLMFTLTDGEELSVKAPWHSNAESLFKDTGIDLRRCHRTFVVIAEERHGDTYRGVICKDEWPVIGPFDRGEWDAQGIANVMGRHVFLYKRSHGGSSSSPIYPVDDGEYAYHNAEGQREYPTERYNDYIRRMDKEGKWQGNPEHPKYPWK